MLTEEKVALSFGNGSGDLSLNLGAEGQDLMLAIEHWQQAREALLDRVGFQQRLALGKIEVQIDRDEIGKVSWIFRV